MFVIVEMMTEDTSLGTVSEVLNVWGPYPSREVAEQVVPAWREEVRRIAAERGIDEIRSFLVRPIKAAS